MSSAVVIIPSHINCKSRTVLLLINVIPRSTPRDMTGMWTWVCSLYHRSAIHSSKGLVFFFNTHLFIHTCTGMYARMFSIPGNEMMIPTYIFLYGSTEDGNANVALPHCLKTAVPSHARCPVGHLFSPTFLTSMRNGHTTDNHWTHGWIFPLSC